ncbi:hypothetical protein BC629DRAFT_802767 [Irpex lacteus]|nr:hypothetical protein BC629DRAFT_802767 [Irpex lacteus]
MWWCTARLGLFLHLYCTASLPDAPINLGSSQACLRCTSYGRELGLIWKKLHAADNREVTHMRDALKVENVDSLSLCGHPFFPFSSYEFIHHLI